MDTTAQTGSGSLFGFLDRSRTIAKPGFSRWMVPPAALCVHLCIGQAYAFSVFNLPMTKLIGISQSAPNDWNIPAAGLDLLHRHFRARLFRRDLRPLGRRRRPPPRDVHRRAVLGRSVSSSPRSASTSQSWVVYFGYGLVGGCGLGIGYISPVSTLIKWFPDRPGMATGMAIMGFGGGAFIASPLSVWLMSKFSTPSPHRGGRELHRHGCDLFRVHDGGRVHRAHSGARLEAGRLRPAGAGFEAHHHQVTSMSTTR